MRVFLRLLLILCALPAATLLTACGNTSYYFQSVSGHLALLNAAQPVPHWLADPHTPPALKTRLELAQRMRRFANDLLSARNINLRILAPETEHDLKLGVDVRREVFLIFKESINNMLKHAQCTQTRIELNFDGGHLFLRLRDNGRGFDTNAESEGHGLMSMRDRARGIGGTLEIRSVTNVGTTVVLEVPLEQG